MHYYISRVVEQLYEDLHHPLLSLFCNWIVGGQGVEARDAQLCS